MRLHNLRHGNKASIMKYQAITNAVRAGIDTDGQYGDVMPPVVILSLRAPYCE